MKRRCGENQATEEKGRFSRCDLIGIEYKINRYRYRSQMQMQKYADADCRYGYTYADADARYR